MAVFKIYLSDGITQLTNIKNVSFKEAVNAGDDLRPGCVGSAAIEFEVFDTQGNAVSVGDTIFAYCIDVDENATLLGKFNCEPKIDTKNSYKVEAYDNASKLNTDFSQWLQANQSNFPMTVYALVSAACTAAGVTLGSASWGLSTQSVQAFYADGVTCRDILSYAAELAGCFVRCHTDGSIYFDWYSANSNSIAPSSGTGIYAYKQDGLTYANYATTALARVAVHPSGEDDVAYIYPTGVTSGNTLHIKNNLLLTGADASFYNAAARQVYTEVSAVGSYCPMSVSLFPRENPFHAGDIVSITDAQGVTISAPITGITISNAAATLISEGRKNYEDTTETAKAITQLASDVVRINKLKVDWADIDTAIINYLTTNNVTAQNLTIVDANDNVLATFNANGITLGQTNQGHMVLDFNSFELYDKYGILYTNIGDMRGADGYFTLTETFVTTEPTSRFDVSFRIASVNSVKINGVATQAYHAYTYYITTNSPVATGKTVAIEYKTAAQIYRYDFGTRDSGTNVGAFSVVCGAQQSATERYSAAVGGRYNKARGVASLVVGGDSNSAVGSLSSICGGYNNTIPVNADFSSICGGYSNRASGAYSFVGGGATNASSGAYSFASNRNNAASGDNSSALGHGNKARGESQFAFGKYCIEDNNNEFAEVVGNGTADNARSNARTLDWSGNEVLAGGLTTGDDVSVTGDITATGALGGASVSVTGNATVGGNLSVTGDATIGGDLSVSGGFTPSSPIAVANGGTGANNATDALTNLGAVAKTGDTMSGELLNTSYFSRKLSSAPSFGTMYYAVRIKDQNDVYRGSIGLYRSSTYGDGIRILHAKDVNGTTISNGVTLYIGDSGTPYVVVDQPSAWRTALGAQPGDTLSFGTESYVRWAGDWRNTTNLWFTIPLNMNCTGLTATVSGSVIVISNNTRTVVSLSSVTTNCYVSHTGVTVNMAYSSAPSYAVASGLANVQAYGLTITFS